MTGNCFRQNIRSVLMINIDNPELHLCLEKIESPAYVLDKDGSVTNCNNSFLHLIDTEKNGVVNKKINQLNVYSPETMHQNNMLIMASKADYSSILEFIKNENTEDLALFQSQKKVIRDKDGSVLGLLVISKRHVPQQQHDTVSLETKHQLREVLNALYGYNQKVAYVADVYDAKLAVGFQRIVDKLNEVIGRISVERIEDILLKEPQQHWCKVVWISNSIASFVFKPDTDGVVVDRVDSAVASSSVVHDRLVRKEYQIILIDQELLGLLPWDFRSIAESSLIIQVGENQSRKEKDFYLPTISHNRLIDDYQVCLPQMWQDYVRRKTLQKVNESGVLRVLSIEDDHDSQDALKQLLELHKFIEVEICPNAKDAEHMISECTFDLIVLDLGLPDAPNHSGYDLALWIRSTQKQKGEFFCPIIANTGHEFMPGVPELFRRGVNELYRKPDLLRHLDTTLMDYVPKSFLSECV